MFYCLLTLNLDESKKRIPSQLSAAWGTQLQSLAKQRNVNPQGPRVVTLCYLLFGVGWGVVVWKYYSVYQMHRIKFIPFNFRVFLRAKSLMGFQASGASAPPFYTQTSHFLNVPGSRGTSFSLSGRQTVFHQSRPTRLRKFFQEDPQTYPALQNLASSNQAPKLTSCPEPGRGRGKARNFPGPAPPRSLPAPASSQPSSASRGTPPSPSR